MSRAAVLCGAMAAAILAWSVQASAQPFSYNPPGQLADGSGDGREDYNVYVPGMRFPIEVAPAYANSQVWGNGGMYGPGGGQCDAVNYSYPWSDNYCETRTWDMPLCPTGQGHQGQDIRPSTCEKAVHWAVAAEDGTITNIGEYSLAVTTSGGTRHNYLHMEPSTLTVSVGDGVTRGQRLGKVSNAFGGTPTSIHLHYEIVQNVSTLGNVRVPPYMSLIRSYEELIGTPAAPCAVIPPPGGVLDDSGPCALFHGPPDSWRFVTGSGNDGNLRWTYAWDDPDPGNWAQWMCNFEEAGEYEVAVNTLPAYAQSKQARYLVRHAGVDAEVVLDQSAVDGWQSLGTFQFAAGGDQEIAVYDNTGEALDLKRMLMMDAVRFTRVVPPEPDATPEAGPEAEAPDAPVEHDAPAPVVDAAQDATPSPAAPAALASEEPDSCACRAVGSARAQGDVAWVGALALLGLVVQRRRRD